MKFQKILIALDDTPVSAHAAEVGIELAQSLAGEVAFIHAIDPALGMAPETGVPAAELIQQHQQDGKKLLAEFRSRVNLRNPPLEFVEVGKPAEEIVKTAKNWPANIIVIGTHGRSGVGRLVLGSVAEEVIRHADRPVLVVRAPL